MCIPWTTVFYLCHPWEEEAEFEGNRVSPLTPTIHCMRSHDTTTHERGFTSASKASNQWKANLPKLSHDKAESWLLQPPAQALLPTHSFPCLLLHDRPPFEEQLAFATTHRPPSRQQVQQSTLPCSSRHNDPHQRRRTRIRKPDKGSNPKPGQEEVVARGDVQRSIGTTPDALTTSAGPHEGAERTLRNRTIN